MPDEIGVDRTHFVDDETMRSVWALIHAAEMRKQNTGTSMMSAQQVVPMGFGHPTSMGSLPSAGSLHSSASSLGSNISQPAPYNTLMTR